MSVPTSTARALFEALESGTPIAPIRDSIDNSIETAYAIQKELVDLRVKRGEKIVGKKIGLTSPAVQKQLGVDQPDYGVLFDSMDLSAVSTVDTSLLMQPKVEGELTFVLGEDLRGEITMEKLKAAIVEVRSSIEIVGSRVKDWDIRISDTIADNASGSHFVLGQQARSLSEVSTAEVGMRLYKNGSLESEGSGAACMGDPLNAALWLAQTMASHGSPLLKGEVLLSGALGPMVAVEAGDQFILEIDGFDSIPLNFS
jgi:2-keto-4-pentenoate hydratase